MLIIYRTWLHRACYSHIGVGQALVGLTLSMGIFQVPSTHAEVLPMRVSNALLSVAHKRVGSVSVGAPHGTQGVAALGD